MKKSNEFLRNVGYVVLGGIGLILINSFVSAPPSRAEFDSFKATMTTSMEFIKTKLTNLDTKLGNLKRVR